ncbi:hypothetical protein HNP84_002614 [Thermocatellispora tengchongensis]|uniref:Uncharacterized protein n=1 Tax=Thermocatellispora tengchongensis TaxID=1073253 RepID=A0A840P4R2_9ACTN|nr:hypothetical protein [Thermocatellispora tengchongensis]MBB5132893.1 hypothetical protein [Thermocatellispora tengchongensis]
MTEITICTQGGCLVTYTPETDTQAEYECGGCGEFGTDTVQYVHDHASICHRSGLVPAAA